MSEPYTIIQQYLQDNLSTYLALLRQMVEINSFTSNSQGVNLLGEMTARTFACLDFQAELVPSRNPEYGKHLFLRRKEDTATEDRQKVDAKSKSIGPSIALISHLDTVFPPEEEVLNDFFWRQFEDRIYGPGTVDIKGGTIMIYMVLDAIRYIAPRDFDRTNWFVCLNASEEVLSDDFATSCKERFPLDLSACLVFEGGTPHPHSLPLVIARKGRATFQVRVNGRSAHAGNYHRQGANAILQIAHTIQAIQSLTDYDQRLTYNVGTVNGGSVVNRVPHFAEASVEMRALTPSVFEAGFSSIMAFDGSSQVSSDDGYPCRVSITPVERTAPWPQNKNTAHLYTLWSESANQLGMNTLPEERGGLSDGNLLWEDFPTLDGLGPSGANAHCSERSPDGSKDQEYVLVSSFIPKALLNALAILKLVNKNQVHHDQD